VLPDLLFNQCCRQHTITPASPKVVEWGGCNGEGNAGGHVEGGGGGVLQAGARLLLWLMTLCASSGVASTP
jgi:hypothetical protein